jgi:3'(2'), 5'-bisphosphate nucleotidase
VAGVALVQAAGGVVTDLDGEALDFSQGNRLGKQGLIAASPQAHRHVLDAARLTLR